MEAAGWQASSGAPIGRGLVAVRMAAPEPECSRCGASLRATLFLVLTVVLSTVVPTGNSVDVVSSSNELLASSSPSPASPRPTTAQLPSAPADLTTVRMKLVALSPWNGCVQFPLSPGCNRATLSYIYSFIF